MAKNYITQKEIDEICSVEMSEKDKKFHDIIVSVYKSKTDFLLYTRDYKGISFRFRYEVPKKNITSCIVIYFEENERWLMTTLLHEYAHHIQRYYFPSDEPVHSKTFYIIFHALLWMAVKKGIRDDKPDSKFTMKEIFGGKRFINKVLNVLPKEFYDIVVEISPEVAV